jgi:signal transduction histidine kinase/CheY-like chemotaxis protein
LLEETQRQAEELESQQEELKQFNDELLDKIKSIEISEAALKVQQEELQQSNAELEETANMLEGDKQVLEKAKIAVEEKARSLETISKYKSEFLANMSHELRTPLNSILILTQLLIENKHGSLNEKEIKYTNVIYNAGNELLTLINDILDLSKVESGNMELVEEEVSIQEVVSDMSMMFSEVAKNKSIEFTVDISNIKEKLVYTDKQRLEQILRNFLSNAFKFTPANGRVTLSVHKASDPEVELTKLNSPNIVAFSVTDTGIGIQKDKQELIFEAFRQVDSTDKRKYGGTGLGLSISRELADLLGGEIDLTSEEGKGSTFIFYLPIRFPIKHDATQRTQPVNGSELKKNEHLKREEGEDEVFFDDRDTLKKNSRTILIMEDDKDFAQVILDFVRQRNYKGIIAHQGNIGLSYARYYKPDAILLDMKLPVIDGEEVIRQLKNDSELRHIPIQIISGFSLRKEAMKLGAFDFIKKPVKKEDLEKVFEKLEDFASRKYKRLLIIENNPDENKAMCDLIGNGDVECIPAFSINEAYKKLSEVSFDCIVVDIGVSDPSGFEFLEKIKADSSINQIPIIVYSVQDLTKEQNKKLGVLANTVVLKTALSHERLLDETTLFLHRVEANMPKEKQSIIRKLHQTDIVLKDKTVLIVDDDMRNIYSLTSALEEEGMHCLTAENGREAVKLLNKNPDVNIILMDVMMPEMDGYEATVEIRKSKNFAKVPIIAITAKAMKGDREKCLAVGMSDYISKPVDINQLLSLMRVWLYN